MVQVMQNRFEIPQKRDSPYKTKYVAYHFPFNYLYPL